MSWADAVNEAVSRAQRSNIVIADDVKQRVQTPEGLIALLQECAQRMVRVTDRLTEKVGSGQLLPREAEVAIRGNNSVYLAQKALYEAIAAVPGGLATTGIQPPSDPSRARPAARNVNGLGNPLALAAAAGAAPVAVAGAGASTLALWAAGLAVGLIASVLALMALGVVAALIYMVFTAHEDTQRIATWEREVTTTFDACIRGGSTPEACAGIATNLHPPPPSTKGDDAWWLAALPIAGGIAVLGIVTYAAVGLFGKGGGSGSGIVVINPSDEAGYDFRQSMRQGGALSAPVLIGGALLAAIGYFWWTGRTVAPAARPAAPRVGPTGNLSNQLFGRGAYGNSANDMPQKLSFDQFTSKRGPRYDLEVGR